MNKQTLFLVFFISGMSLQVIASEKEETIASISDGKAQVTGKIMRPVPQKVGIAAVKLFINDIKSANTESEDGGRFIEENMQQFFAAPALVVVAPNGKKTFLQQCGLAEQKITVVEKKILLITAAQAACDLLNKERELRITVSQEETRSFMTEQIKAKWQELALARKV